MTLRLGSDPTNRDRRRRYDIPGLRVSLRSVRPSINMALRKPLKSN